MYIKPLSQTFDYAWVIFQNQNSLWWLRFLRRGFRHCYILIPLEENSFLELNPGSNQLFVTLHRFGAGYDYPAYLSSCSGVKVCAVSINEAPLHCAPWAPFTCVEFVKRFLGIHDFKVITPYQLYKKIKNSRKKVLTG